MKIIALEEHSLDMLIGAASLKVCNENYPYYYEFTHPQNYFSQMINPFELGERRIKEMDKNGIDIEILSYTNTTQWLSGPEALKLSKSANDSRFTTNETSGSRQAASMTTTTSSCA